MTQPSSMERGGAPGSAYISLVLGIVAIAAFSFPPLPLVVGIAGLAAALHARGVLLRDQVAAGTVPSLLGAILSVIGILTITPWIVGVVLPFVTPR